MDNLKLLKSIVGSDLLFQKVHNLSGFREFQYIVGVHYSLSDSVIEDAWDTEVDFLVSTRRSNERFVARIRLGNAHGDLSLNNQGIRLEGFHISDISGSGWVKDRYYVHDYERDGFEIYCSSLEIISVWSWDEYKWGKQSTT